MELAVIKQGPKTGKQLAQLDALAVVAPTRVPRVLGRWHDAGTEGVYDGYAMEMLSPLSQLEFPHWWPMIAYQCAGDFWREPPCWPGPHVLWRENLQRTLGIDAPWWSYGDETQCAIHGDPTLCNTMKRVLGHGPAFEVVFVDPVLPERVPQIAAVDQARIVQSMLGWEVMTGFYQKDAVLEWWPWPGFLEQSPERLRVLLFWVRVMMARVAASSTVAPLEAAWAAALRDRIGEAIL